MAKRGGPVRDWLFGAADKKLCKELCRLPVLWMKPEQRTVENIHHHMLTTIDVSKDKAQRFLNRISVVYSNVDAEYKHGNNIGTYV